MRKYPDRKCMECGKPSFGRRCRECFKKHKTGKLSIRNQRIKYKARRRA